MAIKSGVPIDRVELGNGVDVTVLATNANETKEVYQLHVHDTAGLGGSVELFISTDATSNPIERIEIIVLSANQTFSLNPVALARNRFLIAKSNFVGATLHGAFTNRDGADA